MKKYSLIIDVGRCENCNNCFLSCKDEHCGNDWPGYSISQPLHGQRWMDISRKERGQFPLVDVAYLPKPCMHCDDAPCIKASRDGGVYKRADGVVLIDPIKAKGQKNIVNACPYGAIWWNEEAQVAQKCTLCAHLLDQGWKAPRCVQACPTGALSIQCLESGELEAMAISENMVSLPVEGSNTMPRVFYKNLHLFTTCMIAGSVGTKNDGISECAVGATVKLLHQGMVVAEQVSDDFGDFKFDGLSLDSEGYEIEIIYGDQSVTREITILQDSLSLATLWI